MTVAKAKPKRGKLPDAKPLPTPQPVVEEEAPEVWKCPEVELMTGVRYWPNGNLAERPEGALVTSVNKDGDGNIQLTVVGRNSDILRPVMATVLHRDDPRMEEQPHLRKNGVWDLTVNDKLMNAIKKKFPALMAEVLANDKSP